MPPWRLSVSQDEQRDVGDGVVFIGPSRREEKEHLLPTAGSEISSRSWPGLEAPRSQPGARVAIWEPSSKYAGNCFPGPSSTPALDCRAASGKIRRQASMLDSFDYLLSGRLWEMTRKARQEGDRRGDAKSRSTVLVSWERRRSLQGGGAGERRKKVGDMQRKWGGGQPEEESFF